MYKHQENVIMAVYEHSHGSFYLISKTILEGKCYSLPHFTGEKS